MLKNNYREYFWDPVPTQKPFVVGGLSLMLHISLGWILLHWLLEYELFSNYFATVLLIKRNTESFNNSFYFPKMAAAKVEKQVLKYLVAYAPAIMPPKVPSYPWYAQHLLWIKIKKRFIEVYKGESLVQNSKKERKKKKHRSNLIQTTNHKRGQSSVSISCHSTTPEQQLCQSVTAAPLSCAEYQSCWAVQSFHPETRSSMSPSSAWRTSSERLLSMNESRRHLPSAVERCGAARWMLLPAVMKTKWRQFICERN